MSDKIIGRQDGFGYDFPQIASCRVGHGGELKGKVCEDEHDFMWGMCRPAGENRQRVR